MTFADRQISWGQLDAASASLAAYLHGIGVAPGDRFGCLLGNAIEWCVGFAAAIRLGAIMVPLNTMFGTFELRQIAADGDCAAILSTSAHIAKIDVHDNTDPDCPAVYDMRSGKPPVPLDRIIATGQSVPRVRRSDADILAICYTSGTTGTPKGVALTHHAVETMNLRVGLKYGWKGGEERFLILAPLAFTGGIITNLAAQFVIGASGWLEKTVDPARALDVLVRQKITFLGAVPSLWERVAAAPGFAEADLSALKSAGTGGAPVAMDLVRKFIAKGVTIRQQYGVSENCGTVACPDTEGAATHPEACGPPVPGVDVEIRDDAGLPVPPGTIGEICVRSDQLMLYYWKKPKETAEAFDGAWFKTGDLGYFDENGSIRVTDRKKNMLISGGVNIYPAEVELALRQIEGVEEVAVLGLPSKIWGQEVAAIVHAPTLSDVAVILATARMLIGTVKAPKQIVMSAKPLPKTASNKIARTGLLALFEELRGMSH